MITALILIIIFIIVLFFWYFAPFSLWYKAKLSGIEAGLGNMAKMRLQSIPHELIISNLIKANNAGLPVKSSELMQNYLAGVNIENVVDSAIRAKNAGISLNFNNIAKHYLAKVDTDRIIHALITAHNAGINTDINELASFYLSNVDIIKIVDAAVSAKNAGYEHITLQILKEHNLSNGNVIKAVNAYIAAKEAHYNEITFKEIAAIDLTELDVTDAVNRSINPVVIETDLIKGICADGIEIQLKLKLTVRADLKNIIGGANEQTVFARVNEYLTTEIGRTENHQEVLRNPYELAQKVQLKELGRATAFEILSVDVSNINVGKDIQAKLLKERAKANAEKAKTEYIKAEEKVQKAMASAFLDGNLSVNDYQKIQNTEADTKMRKDISNSIKKDKK
jgi:uncharacterized protein YqfA (UPF0365 family)